MNSEQPGSSGDPSFHLDDETLERFADGALDAAARSRVQDHADRCASCAALLKGLTLLQQGAGRFDPGAPRTARASSWRVWVPAAVAAAVAIAVFVPWITRLTNTEKSSQQTREASADHQLPSLVAPAGRLSDAPSRFQWRAYQGASHYDVLLFREDGTLLWQQRVEGLQAERPEQIPLPPGRYYWRIRAMTTDGSAVDSQLTRFEIKKP